MTDRLTEGVSRAAGAVEGFIQNLPGINGYMDKETRRDADKRLRTMTATQLEGQQQDLFDLQRRLLDNGKLGLMDNLDKAIQKLQIVTDRIKTASYGYAGFFDAVQVREAELDALHRFDTEMAESAAGLNYAINNISQAIGSDESALKEAIVSLTSQVTALDRQFDQRRQAIEGSN